MGMETVALDQAKLFVLMSAGAIFSLAGLWLMFRPAAEGEAAKIEVFGLKFQSSSAGLLVFLIGAAFLAVPIFVPERPESTPAEANPANSQGERPDLAPPRERASGKEIEPNDGYEEANQIEAGDSIAGHVHKGSDDWFVVPVRSTEPVLDVSIRNNGGWYGECGPKFYSLEEKELPTYGKNNFPRESARSSWPVPLSGTTFLFIRLSSRSVEGCRYELFTSYPGS